MTQRPKVQPAADATAERKDQHLQICLEEPVYAGHGNGFAAFRFDHDALPEIALSDVDTSIVLFGKQLSAPLIIGAMTGGTTRAGRLNRILAEAAEATQIGMALGSQRGMIEDPATANSYDMRPYAPSTLLFGNLGAVQLNYGVDAAQIQACIERSAVDALNLHLNPLQEAIQPEGNTDFRGLIAKIAALAPQLSVPLLLKEVGAGISETTAKKIAQLPIAGVEVAGVGGTSWAKIEAFRRQDDVKRQSGLQLADWGVPTAESLEICQRLLADKRLIASGGMRSGLELAKALALGADAAAMAMPFLEAAQDGVAAVVTRIEQIIDELKTVMFVCGCRTIDELRTKATLRRTSQ
ncbi:MAG: type 2 isopentenyl-diphosphate Delta-isomerase [Deltaproteobacteria bacterium]|nr:type 2 isopentenyl-diphosphate Delta-isomerase [Deltaproteobacteria bacterium]